MKSYSFRSKNFSFPKTKQTPPPQFWLFFPLFMTFWTLTTLSYPYKYNPNQRGLWKSRARISYTVMRQLQIICTKKQKQKMLPEWGPGWMVGVLSAWSLICHHHENSQFGEKGKCEGKWLRYFSNKLHLPLCWAQPPCTLHSFFAHPSVPLSSSLSSFLFFEYLRWVQPKYKEYSHESGRRAFMEFTSTLL